MTLTHNGHVMGLVCEYLMPVLQYKLSKNIWIGKHYLTNLKVSKSRKPQILEQRHHNLLSIFTDL